MTETESPALPRLPWIWLGALLSALIAWWARPILPIDETRYVSVAWEMWRTGEFLVPHINGVTYSHKPPLLFWLMQGGWAVFGVNLWWPRLLGFLFLSANALLLRQLLRQLWPDARGPQMGALAAALFLGMLYPFLFGTMIMFDLLLLGWILCAWLALLQAHRGQAWWRSMLLFGLGIGGGILAKGPVVLLFALPPALAAAHWSGRTEGRTKAVALTATLGTMIGAAIALAWAIPAGLAGGQEYRDAIFWGQTAGRVSDSFAHARPWHWYLPILPAMLLPWPLLPGSWRQWRRPADEPRGPRSDAWRFLAWSSLPAFLILCLMSGKQPHYLLPIAAIAAAALAAHLVLRPRQQQGGRLAQLGPVLLFALFGGFLLLLPHLAESQQNLAWLTVSWSPLPGLMLLAAAVAWLWLAGRPRAHLSLACAFTPLLFALLHLGLRAPLQQAYDLKPMATQVASWQAAGEEVAFFAAKYHGQYSFLGRLEQPVANPQDLAGILAWAEAHPGGHLLVVLDKHAPVSYSAEADAIEPYGVQRLALWRAGAFLRANR